MSECVLMCLCFLCANVFYKYAVYIAVNKPRIDFYVSLVCLYVFNVKMA